MANDWYEVERAPEPHQRLRAEVIKAELQSLEVGFARLPSRDALAGAAHLLAVETAASAANVYVLESEYPFSSLVTGATVQYFVVNTNDGACTANVDGTGVKDLVNANGDALNGNELVAGWPAELIYNGQHWRLKNSAKAVTVGVVLTSALIPQNYQRNVAIEPLVMPEATGGAAPYSYAATGLPAGLSYTAATRTISGTPTAIGSTTVTYTVTDANSNSFAYQLQIRVVTALIMLPDPQDRILTVGATYTFTLSVASGGTAPYFYTIENLPDGLQFDAETREISGSPQAGETGIHTVTLSVADSGDPQQTQTQDFTLTVRSAATLSLSEIEDRSFPPATSIVPFTVPSAHGGVPPYHYIVVGLGEGLDFDEETRTISGTPTVTGDRTVHVRAQDAADDDVEQSFTLTVQPAGARYTAVSSDRDISATDIQAGESFDIDEQSLMLPTWTGDRYLVIAQPATQPDSNQRFARRARELDLGLREAGLYEDDREHRVRDMGQPRGSGRRYFRRDP